MKVCKYCSLTKEGLLWIVHPSPSLALFLLRSRTYLKEHLPSTSNREFPLSNKPEDVVRLVYAYYKLHSCTVVYISMYIYIYIYLLLNGCQLPLHVTLCHAD